MTDWPTGTVLSAKDLKRIADEKETSKLREILDRRKKEEDEEQRARQDFMECEVKPEGIERFNSWVRRAAEQGQSEIQLLRFPSQYCTDHGRAINNFEPVSVTGATYTKFGNRGLGEGGWGLSDRVAEAPFDVDDFGTALIRFANGATVSLDTSWACHQASASRNSALGLAARSVPHTVGSSTRACPDTGPTNSPSQKSRSISPYDVTEGSNTTSTASVWPVRPEQTSS